MFQVAGRRVRVEFLSGIAGVNALDILRDLRETPILLVYKTEEMPEPKMNLDRKVLLQEISTPPVRGMIMHDQPNGMRVRNTITIYPEDDGFIPIANTLCSVGERGVLKIEFAQQESGPRTTLGYARPGFPEDQRLLADHSGTWPKYYLCPTAPGRR